MTAPIFGGAPPVDTTQAAPVPVASSSSLPPTSASAIKDAEVSLDSHLLASYTNASYTDVNLQLTYADQSNGFLRLHALLISRSPVLKDIIDRAYSLPRPPSPQLLCHLQLSDPFIDAASIALSFAYLYSPSVIAHLTVHNCLSTLAAASYLSLDLVAPAFELCSQTIKTLERPQDFTKWFTFLQGAADAIHGSSGSATPATHGRTTSTSSTNGAKLAPNGLVSPPPSSSGSSVNGSAYQTKFTYGPYGERLYRELLHRIASLSEEFEAFAPAKGATAAQQQKAVEGQKKVIEVLSVLPFTAFKETLESTKFAVPGGDVDRFNLGKRIVAERKRRAIANPGNDLFEETVVLQFGGGGGPGTSNVVVLQKARKLNLWKVGAATERG